MSETLKQKIENYHPDQAAIEVIKSARILLLVGPTGAGKDTLKDALLQTGHYHHLVSHTSRKPRINHGVLEQDGEEYHFISLEKAEEMVDNHEFIEAKPYSGNLYGTSLSEIITARDAGKIAVTDIEVQGVAEYKALDSNVKAVFLLPPNFKVWQERLWKRHGDVVDAEDYRRRLETALHEIEELFTHDYYAVLISDELDHSVREVTNYIETGTQDPEYVKHCLSVARELSEDIKNYLASF